MNCLPTEVFAHWFLLYIVGVTSSKHQRDPTEISLALSVGEPLHEQSFLITVFNSFFITFSVFRYLKIRTKTPISNFYLSYFPRRGRVNGSLERVTNRFPNGSLERVTRSGSQTGLYRVPKRVTNGYLNRVSAYTLHYLSMERGTKWVS